MRPKLGVVGGAHDLMVLLRRGVRRYLDYTFLLRESTMNEFL